MISIRFLFAALFFTLSSAPCLAQNQLENTDILRVIYDGGYYPGHAQISFHSEDGTVFISYPTYLTLRNDEEEIWKKGDDFIIRLDNKKGIGVFRVKDQTFYKLYFYPDHHPIDMVYKQCFNTDGSQTQLTDCIIGVIQMWVLEQDYLMAHCKEFEETAFIKETQKSWQAYNDKMDEAISKGWKNYTGTSRPTYFAMSNARIERDRFYQLLQFNDQVDTYLPDR